MIRRSAVLLVFLLSVPLAAQAARVDALKDTYLDAPEALAVLQTRPARQPMAQAAGLRGLLTWGRAGRRDGLSVAEGWLETGLGVALVSDSNGLDLGFITVEGLRRAAGAVLFRLSSAHLFDMGRGGPALDVLSGEGLAAASLNPDSASASAGLGTGDMVQTRQTAALAPVPGPAALPLLLAGLGVLGWRRRR